MVITKLVSVSTKHFYILFNVFIIGKEETKYHCCYLYFPRQRHRVRQRGNNHAASLTNCENFFGSK